MLRDGCEGAPIEAIVHSADAQSQVVPAILSIEGDMAIQVRLRAV